MRRRKLARRITALVLAAAMAASGFTVQPKEAAAASVKLNKKKLTLPVGKSYVLKLKKGKKAYKSKKIKWSSSKKKIATVSASGKVKAKKAGKAKITAKLGAKKYVCNVTVQKSSVPATAKPSETSLAPVQSSVPEQSTEPVVPLQTASVPPSENTLPPSGLPEDSGSPEASSGPAVTSLPEASNGPVITSLPEDSGNPETPSSSEPVQTPLPDNTFVPDAKAAKVKVVPEKYKQHILLTVTNSNEEWLDSVELECIFEDAQGYYVGGETVSVPLMMPGEVRKIAVQLEEEDIAAVSLADSNVNVTVQQDEVYGEYRDEEDSVVLLAEEFDEEMRSYSFSLENQSQQTVSGTYLCWLYDAGESVYDVVSASYEIGPESEITEYIDLSSYEIFDDVDGEEVSVFPIKSGAVEFAAHSFTEIDRLAELAENVTVQWTKVWETCVELTITNKNDVWIRGVKVQAKFYNAQGEVIDSGEGELLSMAPKDAVSLMIPVSAENTADIVNPEGLSSAEDTANAVNPDTAYVVTVESSPAYEVTVDEEATEYIYSKASDNEIYTTIATYGEHDCLVTLENRSASDIEGICTIYFRDRSGRFDASQLTFLVGAGETDELFWEIPYEINDEGEEVSRVVSYDKKVVAYKVQEKE